MTPTYLTNMGVKVRMTIWGDDWGDYKALYYEIEERVVGGVQIDPINPDGTHAGYWNPREEWVVAAR